MKRILILIILVALVSVAVWQRTRPTARTIEDADVGGWGVIEATQDVALSAEAGGRIVFLGAAIGEKVQTGVELVRLDEALQLAQIAQAQVLVEAAEANLANVRTSAAPARIVAAEAVVDAAEAQVRAAKATADAASANVRAAQAALGRVEAIYAKLAAGASENELKLANLAVDLSKSFLWEIQARRDAAESGMDDPLSVPLIIGDFDLGILEVANPAAPRQWDLNRAQATVSEAEIGVTVASLQYQKLAAGATAEELALASTAVVEAQARLQVANVQLEQARRGVGIAEVQLRQLEARLGLVSAPARVEAVSVAEAQVAQAKAEVQILEVRREQLTIRSPVAALVTERLVHEGEVIVAGARLLVLSKLDPVALTIYVPETQLGHVHVGQVANVRTDAFSDRSFEGKVVQIAWRAEFTPRNIQTGEQRTNVVFAVRIEIANPDATLKPGMSADAILER